MNQKSSLREVPQFVSGVLTGNSTRYCARPIPGISIGTKRGENFANEPPGRVLKGWASEGRQRLRLGFPPLEVGVAIPILFRKFAPAKPEQTEYLDLERGRWF
jgi:hypothetical protein